MSDSPTGAPSAQSHLQSPESAEFFSRFTDRWWLRTPPKLCPYSALLSAIWWDGFYLAAWPRLAAILPLAVLLFGFIEGCTHWSLLTVGNHQLSTSLHAATFAQMLPLLIVAVVLGSLSANLGFTLVLGYALGDFFWAGAPYTIQWRALELPLPVYSRVPQIASYVVFFFLAAWPIVARGSLVATLPVRLLRSKMITVVLMAIVQALFVYEWTYFAPMGVRQQWDCCFETSPLAVAYFHDVTMPWLVSAAVIAILVRGWLMHSAEKKQPLIGMRVSEAAAQGRKPESRSLQWFKPIIGAVLMTLLISGFLGSVKEALIIFLILTAVLLARLYVLPRLPSWQNWTMKVDHYPPVLRLAVSMLAATLICRLILFAPGQSADQYHDFGDFGVELSSVMIGFMLTLILLPNGVRRPTTDTEGIRLPVPSGVVQAAIAIGLVLLYTKKALADACVDRQCCFGGSNGLTSASTGLPGSAGAGFGQGAASSVSSTLGRSKLGGGAAPYTPSWPARAVLSVINFWFYDDRFPIIQSGGAT